MWMFCSAGISNSVSRGARPSQQPAGGSPTDLWRPARKLFTHWKILNKYFVFLSVAKLDLTLSKHSMVGVVSEEAQCAVFNWWVEWWKGVDVRTGCPTNTRPSLWVSRLVTSEWNEECGSIQYGGETGTVCRYTTHCPWHNVTHDTLSEWQCRDTAGRQPALGTQHLAYLITTPLASARVAAVFPVWCICRPVATLLCAMVTLAPVSPSIIGLALRHTMKVDLFGCLLPSPAVRCWLERLQAGRCMGECNLTNTSCPQLSLPRCQLAVSIRYSWIKLISSLLTILEF